MARDLAAAAQYADRFNASEAVEDAARSLAADYQIAPLPPTSTALLRMLVALAKPTAAIEVGTGTGVSTLALLDAMPPSGILTSIDIDPDRQAAARELAQVAGHRPHRVRMITGRGEQVISRLAPRAYECVFLDSEPAGYDRLVPLALERLSPGGLLVVNDVLAAGAVPNPADRSPRARTLRGVLRELETAAPAGLRVLTPVDAGLLALIRP
ncbi:methyltransferase [Brevibacterium sp. 5221]|uniref:Methyltransferase n=1 Tax=Brevibacterium rongguiense TaxID=2695267 RepID=A0A6N9H9W9_9MICO|nr:MULTISPECIES: class I SAM-dependent methyltransferase [Brevibacterium]MYM20785.1 methyltransferase [Brevibacterium rongguiense]WAL40482.1 class I SAM-dependent methyltransferase [Brevibacterium sp. BRM-1]